jgi:thiosulfate/3-mercaptopyruvate sulfurtransferase
VTAADLHRRLEHGQPPAVLDIRFDVAAGPQRDAFERGHIPGSAFVDLDRDLAGAPGTGGRHPLPSPDQFSAAMRQAGVGSGRPAVVYDNAAGMMAARGWWLLRYFGHPDVTLLDGGLAAWMQAGLPLAIGPGDAVAEGDFIARAGGMPTLDAAAAAALAVDGVLLDARAPERFRGEIEPLDPVAGHIPGARNRSTRDNIPSGAFADPATLRADLERIGVRPGVAVGAYCGSGVTAAHEVLALELAGIPAALYPGSWSEWVSDPSRPVATGP